MRSFLQTYIVVFALVAIPTYLLAQAKEDSTRIEVICWPGVLGAETASAGEKGAPANVVPDKAKPHEPMLLKDKKLIEVPNTAGVSLLVFSKQHQGGKEAKGSITLSPGTKATVDPDAIDKEDGILVDLESGTARVIKEPKSKGNFRVKTPLATMAARGTELWTRHTVSTDLKTNVTLAIVQSGSVVATVGGKAITISSGSMLEIENGIAKPVVKSTEGVLKEFSSLKFEPTAERWMIYDGVDADRFKAIWGRNLNNRVERIVQGKETFLRIPISGGSVDTSFSVPAVVDVSPYKYIVFQARFVNRSTSILLTNTRLTFFEQKSFVPPDDKWRWYVLKMDKHTHSLVYSCSINSFNPKGQVELRRDEIKEMILLRELPPELKRSLVDLMKP